MLKTALRPKWLAFLATVLAVIGVFLALARWQLLAAFDGAGTAADREAYATVTPLGELLPPDGVMTDAAVARPVTASGFLVPGDFAVVAGRLQRDVEGFWVVGHLAVTDDGARQFSLPNQVTGVDGAVNLPGMVIALGWAPDEATARTAVASFDTASDLGTPASPLHLTAKLEAPQQPRAPRGADPSRILTVAPGQLINTWNTAASHYYAGWLLATDGLRLPEGLDAIVTVAIDDSTHLDLLNIFYAIEWVVFCAMALWVWWRMVRDDHLARAQGESQQALAAGIRRELLRELADARGGTLAAEHSPAQPQNQEQ